MKIEKLPFTEKERAGMISLARVAEGVEETPFWTELRELMDERAQSKPVVEPRNLAH